MVACIRRELKYRNIVYAKLVMNGKMTQQKADWEVKCMQSALNKLLTLSG